MLQRSQGDCDEVEADLERFHEADKRASILQEKLDSAKKISNATEIAVIVGTTMGGALVGLGTYFWGKKEPDIYSGWIAILVGVVLIIGAVAVKIAKK